MYSGSGAVGVYLKKSGETVIEVRVPENESGVHHVLFLRGRMGVMS